MDKRLEPEKAEQVIREAVRLQQEHAESVPQSVLEQSAQEIGVDPQFLHEAIRRVEHDQRQRAQRRRMGAVVGGILLVLFVLNLLYAHSVLNRAWSVVQERRAQLQTVQERRQNLIPQLEALRNAVSQEQRQRLEALTHALRHDPAQAQKLAEQILTDPTLRTDWAVVRLMDEIAGSENRIAVERKRYNEAVAQYERTARQFPINLARPLLGYPAKVEER